MKHALIVEDDTFLAGIYAGNLERLGYAVRVASSVSEAVRKLEEARPDVLMLDIPVKKGGTGSPAKAAPVTYG
mgnify:CR=1 FL=1